jgi:hypothetical protein
MESISLTLLVEEFICQVLCFLFNSTLVEVLALRRLWKGLLGGQDVCEGQGATRKEMQLQY